MTARISPAEAVKLSSSQIVLSASGNLKLSCETRRLGQELEIFRSFKDHGFGKGFAQIDDFAVHVKIQL